MKKLLTTALFALGLMTASATPVTVTFEGTVSGGQFNPPTGWGLYGTNSGYKFVQQSDGAVYGYSNNSAWDAENLIIVTPPVQGEVSVVYKVMDDDSYATFYDMQASGSTYAKGSSKGSGMETEYTTQTLSVAAGHCLGIELEYAYLKSVTYEPYDPTAAVKSLTISGIKYSSSALAADADGNVLISTVATYTNAGTVALNEGDAGYTLTLLDANGADLATANLPSLAAGESREITIAFSVPIATIAEGKTLSGRGSYWTKFKLRDGISNATTDISWVDVYPYTFNYTVQDGTSDITSYDFGFVTEAVSKTLRLSNFGGRPVNVTSIEVPAGFSIDVAAPFTVDPINVDPHYKEFTVTVNEAAVGTISGDLKFNIEGADEPLSFTLMVAKAGGDFFFEDFEGGAMPAGWIIDPELELKEANADSWGAGNHVLNSNNASTVMRAITPRLTAQAGETVVFQAGSNSSTASSVITVYYSTNRLDWTKVKSIRNSGRTEEGDEAFNSDKPYGSYEVYPKLFTVQMPEGEGYLAFDLSYARIDDVFGCHAATVAHDLMFTSSSVAKTGVVNYPIELNVGVKNLNTVVEAAGSYVMSLLVNDEVVKTNTETSEIAAGGEVSCMMGYTPHEPGTYNVKMRLTLGEDFVMETADYPVEVVAETAEVATVVGEGTLSSAGSGSWTAPLYLYFKKSQSEMIFTQEYLAQYGITPGTLLNGIGFNGYIDTNKTFTGAYRVYMTPTELSEITQETAVEMTDDMLVYSNAEYTEPKEGVKDTAAPVFVTKFTAPYTYTGGNLLVGVIGEFDTYSTNSQFVGSMDAELCKRAIVRGNDNALPTTVTGSYSQCKLFPQAIFYVNNEPCTFSGTVYSSKPDADNAPLAGAEVVLTSDDVMYKGVSGEDGTFSINVYQSDLTYSVDASAENHNGFHSTESVSFAEGSVGDYVIELISTESGVDNVAADSINVRVAADMIVAEGATDARLAVYSVNGMLCGSAEGNGISTADLAKGIYVLRIEAAEGSMTVRFIKK